MNTRIISLARAFPRKVISNNEYPFNNIPFLDEKWLSFWGIEKRFVADREEHEHALSLALAACSKALSLGDIENNTIDAIICNTTSLYKWCEEKQLVSPRLSEFIKKELKCQNAHIINVDNGCLTFVYSLQIANGFLQQGIFKRILVCSSECMSNILDYTDKLATVFGDGCVAAVLESDNNSNSRLLSSSYKTDSELFDLAKVLWTTPLYPRSNYNEFSTYFRMGEQGQEGMSQFLPYIVPEVIQDALRKSNMVINDIDFFIFHQTSKTMVNIWANKLKIPSTKYLIAIEKYACLSSASIPNTLYEAISNGLIKEGAKVLLAGAAVGWGAGAQIWIISDKIKIFKNE